MNKTYLIGIGFKLINCLIFPVMSLLMLQLTVSLPIAQVFFVQASIGTILSLIFLIAIKKKITLTMPKKELLLYLARAFLNILALKLWIFALTSVGINEATALGYTSPLLMIIMAKYAINERFNFSIILLIAVNILGVLIILQPKLGNIHWQGFLASLGAVLLWSMYEVICKKQSSNQHYMLQSFYFLGITAIMLAPSALTSWQSLDLNQNFMLILLSFLSVTNITVLFIAYSFAPLTYIAPFGYARLVFTVLITSFLHHSTISIHAFFGAALIMIANAYFTYKISGTVAENKKTKNS